MENSIFCYYLIMSLIHNIHLWVAFSYVLYMNRKPVRIHEKGGFEKFQPHTCTNIIVELLPRGVNSFLLKGAITQIP